MRPVPFRSFRLIRRRVRAVWLVRTWCFVGIHGQDALGLCYGVTSSPPLYPGAAVVANEGQPTLVRTSRSLEVNSASVIVYITAAIPWTLAGRAG
jgi:hypothetical protein